ncbi:MAG: Crp/Fnr family transcriptional regulator [Proteobacteria bacterium]|nr:MAG: Crp/Fnr family transcriptional regulator [Pseudomonadota bacterium]
MDVIDALWRVPLFEGLDERQLEQVMRSGHLSTFAPGALIVCEGDDSSCLYVIVRGAVKVFLGDEHGREVILRIENAGDYFGEISFLDGERRSASVMALTDSKLLIIPRRALDGLMRAFPEISQAMLVGLARRIRRLSETARGFARDGVRQRLIAAIKMLGGCEGDFPATVERPSQQDLADMIGASREMVGRILRGLADEGYVRLDGRRLVVVKRLPGRTERRIGT